MLAETREYYVDSNNNKYSKTEYTRTQAKEYSKTLINCYNCIDCIECENCKDCNSCKKCNWCKHCTNCHDCDSCTNCINCQKCHWFQGKRNIKSEKYNSEEGEVIKLSFVTIAILLVIPLFCYLIYTYFK